MQESFGPRTPLDLGGLLSVSGAALGLVWGLVRGNSVGWGSFKVLTTLVVGALLAVGFVIWELRARTPMVPMHFFRARAFSAGNAAIFLQTTSLVGSIFFAAQFFQVAQGNGPLGAGLRLLPWTATLFVIAPLGGVLVNRVGERILASGAFSMFRQLGGAFGVAILAAVFAATGSLGSPRLSAAASRMRWVSPLPSRSWERSPVWYCLADARQPARKHRFGNLRQG